MDVHMPFALLIGLGVALVGCSALIAMGSGRQAMSSDVVRAVKEDW
jgi:putative ABC transport system permease protein